MSVSQVTHRIKRYAIHHFDAQLNEGVFLNDYDKGKTDKATIQQDQDIKIRQFVHRYAYSKPRKSTLVYNNALQDLQTKEIENSSLQNTINQIPQNKDVIKGRSSKKQKTKFKNFIQLTNYEKNASQKNAAMEHRIQVMRNIKLEADNNDKKRSLFYSTHVTQPRGNLSANHSYYEKKNDANYRKDRKKGYVPIGYNGQILEKKDNLTKHHAHFIDMEIYVDPQLFFKGGDRKQNPAKKQTFNQNLFQKARQRKINQLFNPKNVYYAQFRSPPKKVTQQQKKLQFQRRLQNFVNKSENQKVQISLQELKQFKQIVYRRRQLQYFLAQQEGMQEQDITNDLNQSETKHNIGSCKDNTIKKEQVNIQNLKNYEELISAAKENQQFGQLGKKTEKKKKKLEVSFDVKRSNFRKRNNSILNNTRSKTTRRSNTNKLEDTHRDYLHVL